MQPIKGTVYRNDWHGTQPIKVTYGSSVPIQLTVADLDTGDQITAPKIYARGFDNTETYENSSNASPSGNTVTFTPDEGLFVPGDNMMIMKLKVSGGGDNDFVYPIVVHCFQNPAAGTIPSNPIVVKDWAAAAERAMQEAKEWAEKAKEAADSIPADVQGNLSDLSTNNYAKFPVVGEYANSADGRLLENEHFMRTGYIRCNFGSVLSINASFAVETNCFYDSNKSFISSFDVLVGDNTIVVPHDAVYVVLSTLSAHFGALQIKNQIFNQLDELDARNEMLRDVAIDYDVTNRDIVTYFCNASINRSTVWVSNAVTFSAFGVTGKNAISISTDFVAFAHILHPIGIHYVAAIRTDTENYGKLMIFELGSTLFRSTDAPVIANDGQHTLSLEYKGDGNITVSNNVQSVDFNLATVGSLLNYNFPFSDVFFGAVVSEETSGVLIDNLPLSDRQSTWKNKLWYALGDSITAMGYYIPFAEKMLDVKARAFGHSGWSYTELATIYTEMIGADTPNIITLFAGTNDFGHSGTVEAMRNGLETIINGLFAAYPFVTLFIVTPLQRNFDGSVGGETEGLGPNQLGLYLIDYVRAIREIAEKYSIPVIDLYAYGTINMLNARLYKTIDGLHPTRQFGENIGYIIANKIKEFYPYG